MGVPGICQKIVVWWFRLVNVKACPKGQAFFLKRILYHCAVMEMFFIAVCFDCQIIDILY